MLQWIGEVLESYEARYKAYERAIGSLAEWYNRHGYKMMVLKGYASAMDWPRPEHRPCGDIDIWLFNQQEAADKELVSWFKVQGSKFEIDNSHHHHTVFEWQGFLVENHYDFVNVHAHKSNAELEEIFKSLGKNDSHFVEVMGEKVYLPSANLHALFLIRHMVAHFAAAEIILRQVLDWAFFVEKEGKDVDWKWLDLMLVKYHMKDFVNCINAICVGDLGFDSSKFKNYCLESVKNVELNKLKARILNDIISPEFSEEQPKHLLSRMRFRYRRWQANGWKQRLCYNESRKSAFWSGVWNHLLKLSSI